MEQTQLGHGNHMAKIIRLLTIAMAILISSTAWGQQRTVKGRIIDASTHEALPFVHVMVPGTLMGVVSDIDGQFRIPCPDTLKALEFSMMGYESKIQNIGKGNMKVSMRPSSGNLKTVTIKGERNKKRYRRKDNPAVELAQQVIAHKEQNHLEDKGFYSRKEYNKSTMAFDEFHPNFQKNILWKHLPFVEDYIDRTPFDNTEILNISIEEKMAEAYHRVPATQSRTLVTAKRNDGIAATMDNEGMGEGPGGLMTSVDIYQNEINLLENQFVSPLSSTLANATYHYYITDTVMVDSMQCVELSFKPVNKSDYAFVGRMYVAIGDSSYAVTKYAMQVAQYANINFVHSVQLLQDFGRDEQGRYLPTRSDMYGRLGLNTRIKLFKKLYIHSTNVYSDYSFADTVKNFPDSLFGLASTYAQAPDARKVKRAQWNEMRPITLSAPELLIDSFRYELMRTPFVRHTIHAGMILATGYIPTSKDRNSSKFDFGSIHNFYSVNALEGERLRIGGLTKAQLNPRNFADGYVAYGTLDKQFKFGLNLTHTFDDKRRHANEYPLNSISVQAKYDVETPGVSYGLFDQDNVLMTNLNRMMEYVGTAQLRYRKQWGASINLDSKFLAQDHQPVGDLSYSRRIADGTWQPVNHYNTFEWNTNLSLIPNQKVRDGLNSGAIVSTHDNPVRFNLEHSMGWFEGFYYNRSTFSAQKMFWLTPLGYLDMRMEAGKVWNQVPLPKLFYPSGTTSSYFIHGAFNALTPMEFAADQYVSLFANYHMRGFIFNHIPIIRRMKLREVASFALYWGSLSDRNDPDNGQVGLYQLPSHTGRLSNIPYMEYSIGVENIAHIIRIDYVRRLTYQKEVVSPLDCIRVGFEISL